MIQKTPVKSVCPNQVLAGINQVNKLINLFNHKLIKVKTKKRLVMIRELRIQNLHWYNHHPT